MKYGTLNSYSEQELVDCCSSSLTSICNSCSGCNGGSSLQALSYVGSFGITFESSYPYKAVQGACKNSSNTNHKIVNASRPFTQVVANNQSLMQSTLNTRPVGIYVDATSWQHYSSGIFSGCTFNSFNHAVVAVGYDTSGNWKVRNSWSTAWGETGYIRIQGSSVANSACGVMGYPWYPNIA